MTIRDSARIFVIRTGALGLGCAGVLLATACSSPAEQSSASTEQASRVKHPPAPDSGGGGGTGGGACESLPTAPSSCWDWKFNYGFTTDGCYVVDPDGPGNASSFSVYCGGMDAYTPRDYVDLDVTSSAPGGSNTSVFAGDACGCADYVVAFDKVRLDLLTMSLVTSDRTFATATDGSCMAASPRCASATTLGYGSAGSCGGAMDASGAATVDLTGTGLHVAASAAFAGAGVAPGGAAVVSADRKIVTLSGGGDCGTFGPGAAIPVEPD